jgi:hypothetical protein
MSYLRSLIFGREYQVEPEACFVLMPFSPEYLDVFDAMKTSLQDLNVRVHRADELSVSTPIIDDIISQIMSADFIIADLTMQNPNVLYELGLGHVLKDDVILITQTIESVPFDVTHLRLIVYEHTVEGLQLLGTRLRQSVRTLRHNRQVDKRLSVLKQIGQACAVRIQDRLRIYMSIMNSISEWDELKTNDHQKHVEVLPQICSLLSPFTGGVYNLDDGGTVVSSAPINIVGQNYAHREYFRLCHATLRGVVSNSFDSANRPCRIVVVAVPRYNLEGRFIGILDGVIDVCDANFIDIINDILCSINTENRPEITILDEGCEVIASSCPKLLGSSFGGSPLVRKLKEELGSTKDVVACRVGGEIGALCRIKEAPFTVLTAGNV